VTPTDVPKRSSPRRGAILVAAVSGRAIAQAAVEAGYAPLVADFFADADTQALASGCRKLKGDIAKGMQWRNLAPVLEALAKAAPLPLLGVMYGSGFEDRPYLLDRIAECWPLLGNDAATVERIKHPETFFGTLDRLAIPHPATVMARPPKGAGWVAKRRGGAGGSHVLPSRLQKPAANVYYQALVEGRAISVLFLANGRDCRVLGFSEQWTAPAPSKRWRYGGAVRLASPPAQDEMVRAIAQATRAFRITGLASADFMVDGDWPLLLEINPRPGATLDVFACAKKPLLKLHVEAVVQGRLPGKAPTFEGAAASAIVHAPKRLIVPRNMIWPVWTADLPRPGERIDKQRPICTVLARAGTSRRAKRLIETRKANLLAKIYKLSKGESFEQQEERRKREAAVGAAEHQRTSRATGP